MAKVNIDLVFIKGLREHCRRIGTTEQLLDIAIEYAEALQARITELENQKEPHPLMRELMGSVQNPPLDPLKTISRI